MMARYRKSRLMKGQSMRRSRFRSEMPLKMAPSYSDEDTFGKDSVAEVYPEMGDDDDDGPAPDGSPVIGRHLDDDRLMTMCEQLSDLRVLVKRIENMQAGVANDDEAEMRHSKYKQITQPSQRRARPRTGREQSDPHAPQF